MLKRYRPGGAGGTGQGMTQEAQARRYRRYRPGHDSGGTGQAVQGIWCREGRGMQAG